MVSLAEGVALEQGVKRHLSASLWTPQGSAVEELLRVRRSLPALPAGTGLRIALLNAGGWIVQWLEGDEAAAAPVQAHLRSVLGLRHERPLHSSTGPVTLREPFQLVSVHSHEKSTDVARRLHLMQREREQGWGCQPLEAWQVLAAPCMLDASSCSEAVGRSDVVLVASDDNVAVESVRWLAQDLQARMAYQRYAGGDALRGDLGGAYVDVARELSVVTRVRAIPRRALVPGHELLGVRNLRRLVLLLDGGSGRVEAVCAEAVRFLAGASSLPEVSIVTDRGDVAQQALRALGAIPALPVSVTSAPCAGPHVAAAVAHMLEDEDAAQAAPASGAA